jgi:hypothetical protein
MITTQWSFEIDVVILTASSVVLMLSSFSSLLVLSVADSHLMPIFVFASASTMKQPYGPSHTISAPFVLALRQGIFPRWPGPVVP